MQNSDLLPAAISVMAAAIAEGRTSGEIATLGAIFTQLGDSLALLAITRGQQESEG